MDDDQYFALYGYSLGWAATQTPASFFEPAKNEGKNWPPESRFTWGIFSVATGTAGRQNLYKVILGAVSAIPALPPDIDPVSSLSAEPNLRGFFWLCKLGGV